MTDPSNTLVLFDIDMVLIRPIDQVFIKYVDHTSKPFLTRIYDEYAKKYSPEKIKKLLSIIKLSAHTTLVTPDTAEILKEIKTRGYKVFGLTMYHTDKYGEISSIEEWRVRELEKLGISFSSGLPNLQSGVLNQHLPNLLCMRADNNCFPTVFKGIIFTCGADKGQVLQGSLHKANIKPKTIIFIDDKYKNLESVEKYCLAEGIDYLGFEYTTVKEYASNLDLDISLASLQFRVLEHENVWLNDVQALQRLQMANSD